MADFLRLFAPTGWHVAALLVCLVLCVYWLGVALGWWEAIKA